MPVVLSVYGACQLLRRLCVPQVLYSFRCPCPPPPTQSLTDPDRASTTLTHAPQNWFVRFYDCCTILAVHTLLKFSWWCAIKSEASRGLKFFCDCCTTSANVCVCVCVCVCLFITLWVWLVLSLCSSGTPAPQNVKYLLIFVALEVWSTRGQAVCVRMLSVAAAAVLYSVCKYVNISTTLEFVLMAFVNM